MKKRLIFITIILLSYSMTILYGQLKPEMIFVEGDTFKMGRDKKDIIKGKEFEDELPQHKVSLNSFYIGKYEVTVKQYKEYIKDNNKKDMPSPPDSAWFAEHQETKIYYPSTLGTYKWWGWKDKHPMQKVSWYDAVKYCNWLSEKNGLQKCYTIDGENTKCDFSKNGYRLPTEAEWEFAARGGNESKNYIYAGSDNIKDVAWYDITTSLARPYDVGTKAPNELGIYDMSGNVWEWCNDFYAANYYKYSPKENPKGAAPTIYRVLRGGSWHYRAALARIADRDGPKPGFTNFNYGFRIVRSK